MITVDTQVCDNLAAFISSLLSLEYFSTPAYQTRHQTIQNLLTSLSSFFSRLSALAKDTEDSLCWKITGSIPSTAGFSWSTSGYGSSQRLLDGYSISKKVSASYALINERAEYSSKYLTAYAAAGLGEATLTGKTVARLFKNGDFSPSLQLKAEGSAHVLGAGAGIDFNFASATASVDVTAEVGAVYGKAECALSMEKQTLKLEVGAAAVRGKCSISFKIFGATVTLDLSGSLLSAETGLEYSFSSKEWQMGAKLGFIAGLGVTWKVEFD